jgi:hypothetical protein
MDHDVRGWHYREESRLPHGLGPGLQALGRQPGGGRQQVQILQHFL